MKIKNYDELNSLEIDTLREIGSIGTGNAATALSQLLQKEVRITMPEVRIMGYNEAIDWIGGAEEITAGVLMRIGGEINGIMLSVQQMDFVNLVLESMLGHSVKDYMELHEMECSALIEVGNIMISTFINALSGLAGIGINLTVPAFTVDMQGAIMAVPMAEFGGQSDYIMTIGGNFVCENKQVPCRLLLSPDVRSLNFLFRKLGVTSGD
ncbi:MAG: chemotaxis protein CheC [Oscillospiraceae bacterium]|nr:chemotaxis protein CheC [Oscillospiraceae bacterium]